VGGEMKEGKGDDEGVIERRRVTEGPERGKIEG
jgi:hypothetical protein